MRIFQAGVLLVGILPLFLCSGCGGVNFPLFDDANYVIRNVHVDGPPMPTGPYTITFDVLVRDDSGGVVSPVFSLIDDDGGLRFGDDLLSQEQITVVSPATRGAHQNLSVRLNLDCSPTFKVIGSPVTRDSGEGMRVRIWPFGSYIDEAEVYARVERADGTGGVNSDNQIDVHCQP